MYDQRHVEHQKSQGVMHYSKRMQISQTLIVNDGLCIGNTGDDFTADCRPDEQLWQNRCQCS